EKIETSDNSQKEKLVLKEAFYENLASWDKQMKIEIERTKALSSQAQKETTTQSLDNIKNKNSNRLLNNIQETNLYTNLQESSVKQESSKKIGKQQHKA
ncbi:8844_t:CDS:2, partial [Cetraspora pellucida]